MWADLRDTTVGQALRLFTRPEWLQYPEERSDFDLKSLAIEKEKKKLAEEIIASNQQTSTRSSIDHHGELENTLSQPAVYSSHTAGQMFDALHTVGSHKGHPRDDLENAAIHPIPSNRELEETIIRKLSHPEYPFHQMKDDVMLVDWYSEDDIDNPMNWSQLKKAWVVIVIGLYTFVVYMAAPIYSPSVDAFKSEYGVNSAEASLGLALYILGYGTGPLLFSPLSEIPRIGRTIPYIISFALFCITSIPTAIVHDAIGFYVLRFLQGFFGSPCLATGGASIGDVYSPVVLPHPMTAWVLSAYCAPALGPLIAGFAIPVLGWRFSMWEILIAAGPVMVLMLFLPETSSATILYQRSKRLGQADPSKVYRSASEIAQADVSFRDVVTESLLVPMKITFLDPAILFANVYTSLTYGIYYSFFEAFPIVYQGIYGFNLGEMGCAFLAIIVGTVISLVTYNTYIHKVFVPRVRDGKMGKIENVLVPALIACFGPPIGLFLFGWAARSSVHWIVPTIGIVIYPASVFILLQCVFLYIPACYPQYAASVFAATDFTRSAFACGAVLFARPLYLNLGLGPGCSLLAGLTIGCIVGIYLLYHFGESLRKRSKFTAKW